jgi:hypothetical protein
MPSGLDPAARYHEEVVAEIGRLIERQERINDLALQARGIKRAAAVVLDLPAPQPSRVRRLAWRAKRRLVSG